MTWKAAAALARRIIKLRGDPHGTIRAEDWDRYMAFVAEHAPALAKAVLHRP